MSTLESLNLMTFHNWHQAHRVNRLVTVTGCDCQTVGRPPKRVKAISDHCAPLIQAAPFRSSASASALARATMALAASGPAGHRTRTYGRAGLLWQPPRLMPCLPAFRDVLK